jgi:hypothetical protein
MGGYSDKLSYEERWQVIHFIRSLQAKEANLQYSEAANTFNNSIPGGLVNSQMMSASTDTEATMDHKAESQTESDQHH